VKVLIYATRWNLSQGGVLFYGVPNSSGSTAGLSGTSTKLKFLKIVLAISFDSGLRFWCSSARFEATDKAFITIAQDPSSTTTKIRGQARSFYNKG
jgi:hypothetical protein